MCNRKTDCWKKHYVESDPNKYKTNHKRRNDPMKGTAFVGQSYVSPFFGSFAQLLKVFGCFWNCLAV